MRTSPKRIGTQETRRRGKRPLLQEERGPCSSHQIFGMEQEPLSKQRFYQEREGEGEEKGREKQAGRDRECVCRGRLKYLYKILKDGI